MSTLHWIGEEDGAEEAEDRPLPKVYRLSDPELSAGESCGDSSADFSAYKGCFSAREPAGEEEPFSPEEDFFTGEAPARCRGAYAPKEPAGEKPARRSAQPVEQLPAGGVRISDIRPTKKGRCALFFEDEAGEERFLFSVDEETCALQHLRPGTQLSGMELEAVRSQSDLRSAKDKALQYLSLRDHASCELYRKLLRKYDEPTAAAAVAEMNRLGLLDDEGFAVRRAAYLARKGKSRREIGCLLAGLGIGRELRALALEALPEDEESTLRALVEKQYRSKLSAGKQDSVAAALLRRGYPGGLVRRVLWEFAEENA